MFSLARDIAFAYTISFAMLPAVAADATVASRSLGKADVIGEYIPFTGKVVAAWEVRDKKGLHVLFLTSLSGPSRDQPGSNRIERTDLRVSFYSKARGQWVEEWHIKDGVDCPMLDHNAGFFPGHVTVTDLNHDGIAEVTVPYKMFCGGGVDSDIIKVILRQGSEKYAVRGESLVRLRGQDSFGGSYKADASLTLPRNAPYKKHLLKVWKQVYIRNDT
jgi:hypothetical protein